ncbi:hypothetical protein KC19_4G197000 [Ceratodon purpureus]|uniref:Exostosin GT47 domain-containing protein n=1 Tax=Ceratodon purpureus TaxID=3225 RepID=A0A8T0ICU2_CERPU|nr:hypothetical protein KC19_4G197000 [Ceratodon purpureus]KAG0580757.1 hypothetical protein KC19_4G197000 [Ceratodon purpureus]
MRTPPGFFGMSANDDYDVEAAVGETESSAASQKCYLPPSVGFSEQGVQNRGRKGYRVLQSQRAHGRHLQHRYTKWITCPVVAVLIGLLVAILLFQGFSSLSTKAFSTKAISSGLSENEYAILDVDDSVDGTSQQGRFPELSMKNRTRVRSAGMMFRRRVLDTLQGMLWARHPPEHAKSLEAASRGDLRGKSEVIVSNAHKMREEELVYHNFTHFTETYAEMKKTFKIFVYRDGFKPLVHGAKTGGVYATEGLFLKRMEDPSNSFTVSDPKKAHMFLLPYSVRQMVDFVQDPYSRSMRPMKTFIANYVETIASKYPYWNRTHGADHFFVSCHDWAPLSTMFHEELHKNSMKVVCNADLKANFDLRKDVSIPQTLKGGNQSDLDIGNLPPDQRDFFAFYAGQMHGVVRPVLIEHWKGKDPSMKIYEVLPPEIAQNISYAEHMKRSRYCLCPKGFEVNSPRIVEAILSGCVPVIIADNFVLPYSDVLDWTKFSITVAEKDIPHLKKILSSIPDGTYRSMQSRLKYIRRHFVWLEDPEDAEYDSFHMALHSIWRQSKKIRRKLRKPKADPSHILTAAS